MTHPRPCTRFVGYWSSHDERNVHANLWQVIKGEYVAVVHLHGVLIEAVESSALDDLLSYLVSSHGEGHLRFEKPNQSRLEPGPL